MHATWLAWACRWLSLAFMTLAQLGVAFPAAGEKLGWAWVGEDDEVRVAGHRGCMAAVPPPLSPLATHHATIHIHAHAAVALPPPLLNHKPLLHTHQTEASGMASFVATTLKRRADAAALAQDDGLADSVPEDALMAR